MKDDLISRAEAVKMLREKAQGFVVSMFATSSDCSLARLVATECAVDVFNMPAVDAEPVRHGRWLANDDGFGGEYYTCSACNEDWFIPDGTPAENRMNFCPCCGAKMDGDINGK